MTRSILGLATSGILIIGTVSPAVANYESAKAHFSQAPKKQQAAVVLALIATGDFDGIVNFGFTRRLYAAVKRFERRHGLNSDGVLQKWELQHLREQAGPFYADLGTSYYPHPDAPTKLLVPRKLFDREQSKENGILFTRNDKNLSLSYVAFAMSEKSFEDLYATLVSNLPGRVVTYTRLFPSHFVVTGSFEGHKFYTWINRSSRVSAGFTISWSEAWDDMGQKLSALLANTFQVQEVEYSPR